MINSRLKWLSQDVHVVCAPQEQRWADFGAAMKKKESDGLFAGQGLKEMAVHAECCDEFIVKFKSFKTLV